MTGYILRRILLAIPILVGVNLIVFVLFFFVNDPETMASQHLPRNRQTPEQLQNWLREHNLHYPYFYNVGWERIGAIYADEQENQRKLDTAGTGEYRLIVKAPGNEKAVAERHVRVQADSPRVKLPPELNGKPWALPMGATDEQTLRFSIDDAADEDAKPPVLEVAFNTAKPGQKNALILEYRRDLSFAEHFTQTVFWQRSVKMLFFQYGMSDRGRNIGDEISQRMWPSLSLMLPAFLVGLTLNIFIAMLIAFFRGTYVDYWGLIICVILMSISALFYILGFQLVFGRILRLVPISGFAYSASAIAFLAMPIVIAIMSGLGRSVRFYRTIFLEEVNRDYVRTARAKGLPEWRVLYVHALKNALIPILTGAVVSLPFLIMGSLLLESFFAIPGLGSYLLEAIRASDFAAVQAMVALGATLYVAGLLLTDISYTLVDPRVRLE